MVVLAVVGLGDSGRVVSVAVFGVGDALGLGEVVGLAVVALVTGSW